MTYQKSYQPALSRSYSPTVLPKREKLGIVGAIGKMLRSFAANWSYHRTVAALSRLDDHTLKDIGIHRSEIRWAAHVATMSDSKDRCR